MKHKLIIVLLGITAISQAQIDPDKPANWENVGYHGEIPRVLDYVINMKTEGNVVGDGIADDAPAIQTIIDNKTQNYGNNFLVLFFPAGNYKLGSSITIPTGTNKLVIIGDGSDKTIFRASHSGIAFNVSATQANTLTSVP